MMLNDHTPLIENRLEQIPVVIPSLHPNERLLCLLKSLRSGTHQKLKIIIVDDGSGAAYSEIFRRAEEEFSCCVLTSQINQGKGNALKTAFLYVLENLPDSIGVVTVDGDGQHSSEDVISCMHKLATYPNHFILGCRRFDGGNVPLKSRLGNRLTSKFLGLTRGMNISDTQTGLRAIPRSFLKVLIGVPGERYEYEMNMLLACSDGGIPIVEIPIQTIYFEGNKGSHFHPIFDSLKVYVVFLRYLLSALFSCLLDIGIFTASVLILKSLFPGQYILLATAFSRICSSLFNYFVNRRLVFRVGLGKRTAAKYYALAFCQMATSGLLVTCIYYMVPWLSETIIKLLVDTGLFFLSFYIQRKWIFKNR